MLYAEGGVVPMNQPEDRQLALFPLPAVVTSITTEMLATGFTVTLEPPSSVIAVIVREGESRSSSRSRSSGRTAFLRFWDGRWRRTARGLGSTDSRNADKRIVLAQGCGGKLGWLVG